MTKALTNYLAGRLSDRFGRKHVLVGGWLVAAARAVPPHVGAELELDVAANVLLGMSQGLTWSTTVIMKIDLVEPAQRGLAMGLNEFAGYVASARQRAGHGLPGRTLRVAARAVLPGRRLRVARAALSVARRPRDPAACGARSRQLAGKAATIPRPRRAKSSPVRR